MPRRNVAPRFIELGDEDGKPTPLPAFVTFEHLSLDLDMSSWIERALRSSVVSVGQDVDPDQGRTGWHPHRPGPEPRRGDPV